MDVLPRSALQHALVEGDPDAVVAWLLRGASSNALARLPHESEPVPLLMWVLRQTLSEEEHLVRMLLRDGVDVNARDARRWTALGYALQQGKTEAVAQLLHHGADATLRVGLGLREETLWHVWARTRYPADVRDHLGQALRAAGVLIDEADARGHTPMMVAAQHIHESAVHALVSWGASVHRRDPQGLTVFDHALLVAPRHVVPVEPRVQQIQRKRELMQWLLEAGVDPRPLYPNTPSVWAHLQRSQDQHGLAPEWQPLYQHTRVRVQELNRGLVPDEFNLDPFLVSPSSSRPRF